ncbi:MAG: hypothetical protein AAGA99_17105 [Actinomycetota bacterium]
MTEPTRTLPARRLDVRLAVGLVLVAGLLVVSPVLRRASDSYPLSTYPMFSGAIDSSVDLTLAVGLDDEGRRVELSPVLIAGTDEVIVAGGTLRIAVREGRADAQCTEIAARVLEAGRTEIVGVAVLTDDVDAVGWYEGDRSRTTTLHAECDVAW